jgi:hypothetical protein
MTIKYLSHSTRLVNLEKIIKDQYLYTSYERQLKNKSARGSIFHTELKTEKGYELNEFPGTFLSWHTGKNMVFGRINLIFGGDLLDMQKNYHVNLVDRNGFFTESVTYFPEDLKNIPIEEAYKFWSDRDVFPMFNEVVFHDKMHIDLIKYIWFTDKKEMEEAKQILPESIAKKCKMQPKNINIFIKTPEEALNKVDRTSEAIRVYASDKRYDGVKIPLFLPNNKKLRYKSSLTYVKNIARTAGVTKEVLQTLHKPCEVEKYLEKNGYYDKAVKDRH